MVHVFSRLGRYIMIDIESGSLFELEQPAFFVALKRYGQPSSEETKGYEGLSEEAIKSINSELDALEARAILNTKPTPIPQKRYDGIVKSMCINISHNCNLRCKYCFADEGRYGGGVQNMSQSTAKAAIDFLLANSGNRHNLEIDFFGGEPLLNMDTVRFSVDYARERAAEVGKAFKFTLTTNATLLNEETIDYLNQTMNNIVLSIDGRESVHNSMRPDALGKGSFSKAITNSQRLVEKRGDGEYYVRGTFTSKNLDFYNDIEALRLSGFKQISIEPVVLPSEHPLAIMPEHIEPIRMEYRRFAEKYIDNRQSEQTWYNFFHFNYAIYEGPCVHKRTTGCGAGSDYLAVAADGALYPCHQFIGNKEYCLGDVFSGITNKEPAKALSKADIASKPCNECWARYYCGGGCHANAVSYSNDPLKPHEIMCELMRERIECAAAIKIIEELTETPQQ